MCGICGMVGKSDKTLIKAMCNVLVHRGPDGEGEYIDENVAIGIRRLAVIDLETGDQPISNEDKTLWIVHNGEIYNFIELRDMLEKRGHEFQTQSDTEVIIHAYEEFGASCPQHFNGMFAFAIWDTQKRELFMARDRVGIKPFYYWDNGCYLLFGSEIKAILQDKNFDRQINKTALYNQMHRLFVPGSDTMFVGIKRLAPGHYAYYRKGRLEIHKYWDFSFAPKYIGTEKEYCDMIYEQLKKAVRRRMISDVPLGAFLSGGVDSSGIVGFMSQLSNGPVKTFSLGFREVEEGASEVFNELPYARKVAEHLGTEHHEFVINASDILHELPRLIWHFDEPYSGSLPQYFISKLAREHVTVALGGLGGDELFGDYGRGYRLAKQIGKRAWAYRCLPVVLRVFTDRVLKISEWFTEFSLAGSYARRAADFYSRATGVDTAYVQSGATFPEVARGDGQILSKNFLVSISEEESIHRIFEQYVDAVNSRSLLDVAFYLDAKTQLVNEYLNYTDILSMASSLEARVPFLDHELIAAVLSIPASQRSQADDLKYLLKRVVGRLVPRKLFERHKGGFSLPYGTWLRNELRDMLYNCLSPEQIRARGYFESAEVIRIVDEHISGQANHTYRLWTLLMLELWHRMYLDSHCYTEAEVLSLWSLKQVGLRGEDLSHRLAH